MTGIDIKSVYENMKRATENNIRTISEDAFKEIFLPMFVNQENNKHNMRLANWIEFAGGPFMPVKIVNSANEVILVVPPVSNRAAIKDLSAVDQNGRPLQQLADMLATYQLMTKMGPGASENYIRAEMMKRFNLMAEDNVDLVENLKAWNKIFTHYGLAPIGKTIDGPTETKALTSSHDEIEPL